MNRCGRIALRKRYKVFSVQYHLECWSGRNAHKTYGRYGRRRGCSHWTGGTWANDVYRIRGGEWKRQVTTNIQKVLFFTDLFGINAECKIRIRCE